MNWLRIFFRSRKEKAALILLVLVAACLRSSYAQDIVKEDIVKAEEKKLSSVFVVNAWELSSKTKVEELGELVEQVLLFYGKEAKEQQSSLTDFPGIGKESNFQTLNDVATCIFVYAEALMYQGKTEKAKMLFQMIIDEYYWSQAWDPHGWYWSIAKISKASVDKLNGKVVEEDKVVEEIVEPIKRTLPQLHLEGTDKILDYTKYGKFHNVGTKDYRYESEDPVGLSLAAGEGIYPNTGAVMKNPRYKKAKKEGRLKGSHWDFVHSHDLEAAFFKWAIAPEPWGVKLFYIGSVFEKAEMYYEAIKAYHAIVVHFPNSVAWTYWHTPWYPGPVAIAKIKHLIRQHPELNLQFDWGRIRVGKGHDNNISNDIFITYPGSLKEKTFWNTVQDSFAWMKKDVSLDKVVKRIGEGKVQLVQYENEHWQLLVDGKPYIIKGITYAPTKVGQSPDNGTLVSWMKEDSDRSGVLDGPYEAWVDNNKNNVQDDDEPAVGDFQLMKEMGANTLREYHQPFKPDKKVLRKMYEDHGIMVIMGDFLGKYALGSKAVWFEGTDYESAEHKKNMLESVKEMVMEFKDEPYILMWMLGNENNYGIACNADKKPDAYFKFVNEVAKWIKSVDKDHPIALCNGDTLFLNKFAQHAPDVDIFSANIYRGDYGFGSFWEQVYDATGKPAFISEYGSPAYAQHLTKEEAEESQASYHIGNWLDIEGNLAGKGDGMGNALGGVLFEWLDEWWKNYEPHVHDKRSDAVGPFPGGYYYEEWFGVLSQGNGKNSPFLRQIRPSYLKYKELWNN